jgi:hypothetical protein
MRSLCALDNMEANWRCNVCSWGCLFFSTNRFTRNFAKIFFQINFDREIYNCCLNKAVIFLQRTSLPNKIQHLSISAEAFWPISVYFLSFLRGFLLQPVNILWIFRLLAFWRSRVLIQNRPPLDDMPVWTPITYYFYEMVFLILLLSHLLPRRPLPFMFHGHKLCAFLIS